MGPQRRLHNSGKAPLGIVISILVILAIGIGVGFYVSGPNNSNWDGKATITCAFDTWLGYSAFYLADELGYFEDAGLDVHLQVINPLQEKNAAMARGDLDVMGGSIDSAIISSTSKVPGCIVFVFEKSLGNDALLVGPEISGPQDLRGKKIAVEVGYVSHLFLLNFLHINNMTPDDVKIISMTNDEGAAAFVSGAVDGFATFEPFITKGLKRPGGKVLLSSEGMKPLFCGTVYASRRIIENRTDDLKKLVEALQKANIYWKQLPDKGNEIVARRWELPLEDVEAIMVNTTLFTPGDQHRLFGSGEHKGTLFEYLDICAELWAAAGEVPADVDTAALVDGRFVEDLKE